MDNRVLFITQYGVGPPFAGNRSRIQRLLEDLRELGFEIHLADVLMPDHELSTTLPYVDGHIHRFKNTAHDRSVLARAKRKFRTFGSNWMKKDQNEVSIDRWFFPHWDTEAVALQKKAKYSRVIVQYVFHSRFLKAFGENCLKVLDTHDCFAHRNARLAAKGATANWFETTTEGERIGLLRADRIIAIQDLENDYFRDLVGGKRDVFTVGHRCVPTPMDLPKQNDTIGYLSSNNPLNVDSLRWFLDEVWPRILSKRPHARLLIAGTICQTHWSAVNVDVIGEVEVLSEFFKKCSLVINPMRVGTGLKIKTIEALAHGRMVVGTDVAFEGIADRMHGLDCIANDPQVFAQHVLKYLGDLKLLAESSDQAIHVVKGLNQAWKDALVAVMQ